MNKNEKIRQIEEEQRRLADRLEALRNQREPECGDVFTGDKVSDGFAVRDDRGQSIGAVRSGRFVDVGSSPSLKFAFNIFEVLDGTADLSEFGYSKNEDVRDALRCEDEDGDTVLSWLRNKNKSGSRFYGGSKTFQRLCDLGIINE